MPCCGGHGGPPPSKPSILTSHFFAGEQATDALQNLSVLKTLSEHVDRATAVRCYSVCKAWREAFGFSCTNVPLNASTPVDGVRARFIAGLHGSGAFVLRPAAYEGLTSPSSFPRAQRGSPHAPRTRTPPPRTQ